jgi:hypothetical protein
LILRAAPLFLSVFLLALPGISQEYTADDAPGPLSTSHTGTPGLLKCMKCHNEDFEIEASRCLSCHTEIAERIASERGYHRDKTEDCAVCHTEHEGEDTVLIFLDPDDFDHEETGAVLEGPHAEVKDCRDCHRVDNTIARKKSRSYLFRRTGCPACHAPPHPGRQDRCLRCHTQKSWRVDIRRSGGGR